MLLTSTGRLRAWRGRRRTRRLNPSATAVCVTCAVELDDPAWGLNVCVVCLTVGLVEGERIAPPGVR